MKELNKEYMLLFNGISDTIRELELMKKRLESLQVSAERIYLESSDDESLIYLDPNEREVS